MYQFCERNDLIHQTVIIDPKKKEKFVKIRPTNIKILNVRVYKDFGLEEYEICEKKRKKNKKIEEEKEEGEDDEDKVEPVQVRNLLLIDKLG